MSATAEPTVTTRRLLPHEWSRLEPIFRSQGHALPAWTGLPVIVEEDGDGNIIGCILAHDFGVQLELWVDVDHRGNGVATRLAEAMQPEIEDMRPFAAYARNEATQALCERFGMVEQEGRLYVMEV